MFGVAPKYRGITPAAPDGNGPNPGAVPQSRQVFRMSRTRTFLHAGIATLVIACLAAPAHGQTATDAPGAVDRITQDLKWLADDAREGRGADSDGLEAAAGYIADAFAAAGLEPGGTDGFFQPFELNPQSPALAHTELGGEQVKNVVGILPGRGALAGEVVILGAHYDHLGRGTRGYAMMSRDTAAANQIHNGADDNASGTTALLEIARNLAARQTDSRRTFVFVAFTAEELGTIGAIHYVDNPARPLSQATAMLNFDMVGRLRGDSLVVGGTGSSTALRHALEGANTEYGLNLMMQDDPWGASDHAVFYGKEMPVLHFYTNLHADYHTPADDWDLINMDGIARIAAMASDLAWSLATESAAPEYVAVARPPQPSRGSRASLGTMPDMVTPGDGMRVQGVRAGTAAEEAGIQAGDVILSIGSVTVKDVYGLQEALTTYKAGETVTIVFLREGERMETEATLK